MKRIAVITLSVVVLAVTACKKDKEVPEEKKVTTLEVLNDFANTVVNPNYQDIETKANALYTAVQNLNTNTTDANLTTARNAWKEVRQPWEQCEAFLFGPVEDFNYDPTIDTWPVNKVDLDSLLASSNPLALSDIEALPSSLTGFHPIEYLLFGVAGSKTAAQLTTREKTYLASLTQSLFNVTTSLRKSWDLAQADNFTHEVVKAGNGSARFNTRKDALLAIANAMAGICDEVANGKMEDPLAAQDSTLEESQFSHNSTTDFRNNMKGVLNAYLGKYSADGKGLNDLVAGTNLSLDNDLQAQMNAAINAFDNIDSNYGAAVYTQQVQIHNAQDAINNLKETLEGDLVDFIQTYVKD